MEPTRAVPLWHAAVGFACRRHEHQVRKDRVTPYAAHVVRVALVVRDVFGCDDPVAITAALLHDTIEDTATDYDDIESEFGRDVAVAVAALTKNMILREDVREPEYDARLAAGPWQAHLVKLADAYDNYVDNGTIAASERSEREEKLVSRCRRAIAIAKAGAGADPSIARAIRAVEGLISAGR